VHAQDVPGVVAMAAADQDVTHGPGGGTL
jgi:hypothetical protein